MGIYDGIMYTSNVAGDVAESATSAAGAFVNELKKIGKTAFSQILGTNPNDQIPGKNELAEMAKKDEKFSIEEQAKIHAKIKAVYEEFEAIKRKKQQEKEAAQEVQEEETKKLEELNEERVKEQELAVNPAIEKTKAEIKNYGAE